MSRTTSSRLRWLAGLAALGGMLGGMDRPAAAQPPKALTSDAKIDQTTGAILVPLGSIARFDPKTNKLITDITISDESVVFVRNELENPKIIVLTGKQAGFAKVTLTFDDKTRAFLDVVVQPDFELLKRVIKQSVPTANVSVVPGVGGTLILSGYVNRIEDADIVVRIASAAVGGNASNVINALQIGGAQHVLIDMVIAQVDRTELRERGVSFGTTTNPGSSFGFSSVLGGLAASNVQPALFGGGAGAAGGGTAPISVGGTANLVFGIVPNSTVGALRALRTEALAKFLSEPKQVVQSGRTALLRVGGQQAILGPAAGINGPGVVLEQVGSQIEVLPLVFGNGKIYLEVSPQFRSVNNGRGVTTAFGFTPGFNETSIRSAVTMESGQTYAIGGLLETQMEATAEKVPYLGDLPLLGTVFSSVRSQERETELLILVTPRLVDALDCNQVPKRMPGQETRSPDDYELFLESLIEAPRGQRRPRVNGKYQPAYRSDPTYGQYPCIGPDGQPIPGCNAGAPVVSPLPTVAPATVAPAAMPATVSPVGYETPTPEPAPATVSER